MDVDEAAAVMSGRVIGPSPALAAVDGGGQFFGVCTDSRTILPGQLFIAISGPRFDGHDYAAAAVQSGAAACVVSRVVPGLGVSQIVVADTIDALGRLASAHRSRFRGRVIAVTGSNGKTTTKEMLHHVLRRQMVGQAAAGSFNNHIGVPLTLLSIDPNDDYVVVEMGTNAPGEIGHLASIASPDVAVVTSIGEAHLAGLGDVGGVAREKLSLLSMVRDGGFAVVQTDRAESRPALAQMRSALDKRGVHVRTVGSTTEVDYRIQIRSSDADGVRFHMARFGSVSLAIAGSHNASNAAMAIIVAERCGVPPRDAVAALARFQPVSMRMQAARYGAVTVINDAYNANPASMRAAVRALADARGRRRMLVCGDMLELGDAAEALHEAVGAEAAQAGLEMLVAVGRFAEAVARGAARAHTGVEVTAFAAADDAGEFLEQAARDGDLILVKGSRGMRMEQLVARLARRFDPSASIAGARTAEPVGSP